MIMSRYNTNENVPIPEFTVLEDLLIRKVTKAEHRPLHARPLAWKSYPAVVFRLILIGKILSSDNDLTKALQC